MSISTFRPTFTKGDRLRKARELTRMDQKTFAEAMGLHRDSVRKYEATGDVKAYVVRAWADLTGVDENWLNFGDNPQSLDYTTDISPLTRSRRSVERPPRRAGSSGPKGRVR